MISPIEQRATIGRVMPLGFLLAALIAACLMVAAAPAHAKTFTVDRNDDPDPVYADDCTVNASDCSLRGAIVLANTAAGPDEITVPAGTYTLTRPGGFEDAASTGDLDITGDLTITGAGTRTTSIVGGPEPFDDRILDSHDSVSTTITGITITGGKAGAYEGGGVRSEGDLTLESVIVEDNAAGTGGGIDSRGGDLTLDRVTVKGNTSSGYSGGIYSERGTLNITDSTVSGNSAAELLGGVSHYRGLANITNSTISGNRAALSGGGVTAASATINIRNSTIASNKSGGLGGGIMTGGPSSTVLVKNTIVAGNSVGNCGTAQFGGAISSQGNNISSDDSCRFTRATDKRNTNPKLGPLANNGGPTDTHALLAGSPAVDAGANSACPSRDQRGVVRKDGDANGTVTCDIGAFEAAANTKPTISALKPAPGSRTRDNTPLIGAKVSDSQTNLARANIKLFVDGKVRSFSYNASTDRLVHQSTKLKVGTHKVRIMATDSHGASSTKIWGFQVIK